ncbi:hypothetical protein BU24DRAFT_213615 [Aaosphaeria arxii CBS 175.79]|uniref:Cupin type-2 domain-containing protein n=1 Tax=Aaosphaeria arxii CBS 175.79 TaxID=1450172 RepID=A0A6A5XMC2_9PLEO|nr:uncharacterized protein BU24DRAFT_213615 [Aaosphaeria arxii CBS 175.79]KAF2014388.1 hypothetical protein BU24DRAFT_213615 [Aaosphaeria arxii CBS 175.79]
MSTSGPLTGFPAEGLPTPQRFITTHDAEGRSVFLPTDSGDHQAIMVAGAASQSIMYSTDKVPINLNEEHDVKWASENQPGLHVYNGVCVRTIDFAPGAESIMHRAITLGVGTVCEGEFEFSLDSGEKRIMRPGDVSVNRGTMHKWKNLSETKSARMIYFLVDVEPLYVNGKKLEMEMGTLGNDYVSV